MAWNNERVSAEFLQEASKMEFLNSFDAIRICLTTCCRAFQILWTTGKSWNIFRACRQLRNAVYGKCWMNQRIPGRYSFKKEFSMHAQIFAVLTNTIPEKSEELVQRSWMIKTDSTTMYFRFYLTQALKKTGLADQYLETLGCGMKCCRKVNNLCRKSRSCPLRLPCLECKSRLWFCNRGWYSSWITGFKTVEIEPALGKLTFIKGQMPHPAVLSVLI